MLEPYRYPLSEEFSVRGFLRDKVHQCFEDVCLAPPAIKKDSREKRKDQSVKVFLCTLGLHTHSEHSPMAATSLLDMLALSRNCMLSLLSLISTSAATAFATTVGLLSASRSRRLLTKPSFSTRRLSIMLSFATQMAAVLRTYGSVSFRA